MEEGESGGEGEALPQLVSPPLNNHNSPFYPRTFLLGFFPLDIYLKKFFFPDVIFAQLTTNSTVDVTISQQS